MSVWHNKSAIGRWGGACLLATTMLFPASVMAQDDAPRGAEEIKPEKNAVVIDKDKGTLLRLARPATDVFVVNPNIANIQVKSPTLIYVIGSRVGSTTIYAMDDDDTPIYSATLTVTENIQAQKDMTEMLREYEDKIEALVPNSDISITPFGKMFVIDGTVQSPEQADLIMKLCEPLVSDNAEGPLSEFVEAMRYFDSGMSEASDAMNIDAPSTAQRRPNRSRSSMSANPADNLINRLVIMQPTQVNLRVKFAEISRTTMKELGINWENGFGSGGTLFGIATGRDVFQDVTDSIFNVPVREYFRGSNNIGNAFGGLRSGNFDLNFVIDAMDNEGFLSVLAEPNLTAISGETGNFHAGGEFPIPVPQRDNVTIQFREFGVQLEYTPTVLNDGRIRLKVKPEVSDLSNAGSIQIAGTNIPSISTRSVETTVELGSGQSFAIAGLIENKIVQDSQKLPGLGDIPILGALFRSDAFRRNETELLVVITPYLVKPVDARRIALPTDGYIAPNDMQRYVKGQRWRPHVNQKTPGDASKNAGPTLKGRAGFQLK